MSSSLLSWARSSRDVSAEEERNESEWARVCRSSELTDSLEDDSDSLAVDSDCDESVSDDERSNIRLR